MRISFLIPFRSGDVDAIVPFTGTRSWLDKLALPVEAAFRPWFLGKQTGGYVTKFAPMSPRPTLSLPFVALSVLRALRISVLNPAPYPRYNGLTFATVRNAGDVLFHAVDVHITTDPCVSFRPHGWRYAARACVGHVPALLERRRSVKIVGFDQ